MPASIKHLTNKKINYYSLLAKWKDGLYYAAALVKCDKTNKRCLVCFEDGSELWSNNRDIHIQLSLDQLNGDEDIVCCICDDGNSEPPNEIILCDVCQQGYHQKCHRPVIDSSKIDDSDDSSDHKDWFCATCSYILDQTNRAKQDAIKTEPQKQQEAQQVAPTQQKNQQKRQPTSQSPKSTKDESESGIIQAASKQPTKPVKQTSTSAAPPQHQQSAQQSVPKSSVGPVKPAISHPPKQAPYYPLSGQVRAAASSSTAALASMTASSALVVGSSAGRTKQDLVNQSNRSSQRQRLVGNVADVASPPRHAVRKSSINFIISPPARQQSTPPVVARASAPVISEDHLRQPTLPAAALTMAVAPAVTAIPRPQYTLIAGGPSSLPVTLTTISTPAPRNVAATPVKINPTDNRSSEKSAHEKHPLNSDLNQTEAVARLDSRVPTTPTASVRHPLPVGVFQGQKSIPSFGSQQAKINLSDTPPVGQVKVGVVAGSSSDSLVATQPTVITSSSSVITNSARPN